MQGFSRHMELRGKKTPKQQTYRTYYQGIFLAEYLILKAARVQQGGGLAGVFTLV